MVDGSDCVDVAVCLIFTLCALCRRIAVLKRSYGGHAGSSHGLPPPSRFDPDDLNNFAVNPAEPPPPLIVWAPCTKSLHQSGVLQPNLALFSVSAVGNHLLHQIPKKRILGSIVLDEISMASIVFVSIQYAVLPERANVWTKTVFRVIQLGRVLIIDAISSLHFKRKLSADEPLLIHMETGVLKKATKNQAAIAAYYPSGSLVDGVAAALITYCQLRALEAALLMSWPNTEYNCSPPVSFGFDECVSTSSSKPCGHRLHCCGKIDSREEITCRFRALTHNISRIHDIIQRIM